MTVSMSSVSCAGCADRGQRAYVAMRFAVFARVALVLVERGEIAAGDRVLRHLLSDLGVGAVERVVAAEPVPDHARSRRRTCGGATPFGLTLDQGVNAKRVNSTARSASA
jgi:hypothetical protein